MDEDAFVAALGDLFEHSPWVARAAFDRRPFASVADLHGALEAAMRAAPRERQVALIRAHPELAGRERAPASSPRPRRASRRGPGSTG